MAILLESYGAIMLFCSAFILLDLITGLAKAKIQGRISSSIGYKGFWRKIALISALVFGMCLDSLIEFIDPGILSPIGRIIGFYIVINECISICENLISCGVKLPKFISSALIAAREKVDKES